MTRKGYAVSTPLTDAEIVALRAKSRRVAEVAAKVPACLDPATTPQPTTGDTHDATPRPR